MYRFKFFAQLVPLFVFFPTITIAAVSIDVSVRYQPISGFGHSCAWTSHNDQEMALLWDTVTGAGLSLLRLRIDESTRDQGLIKSTSNAKQIVMAKTALARGVVVWAAPWGPGKDWQTVYGKNSKGQDQIKFNMTYAAQWAKRLADYVRDMKTQGVPLYAVSAQNEPDGDNFNHFEPADLVTWIRDFLGPALDGTGVKIIAPETVNWCSFPTYKSAIMNDAKASSYVPIIATHEYGCSPKAYPEIAQAGKEFWETEIYDLETVTDPGIASGLRTAKFIHEAMVIANMNAWHYWWGHGGQNDGLFPNNSSTPTKRLWVLGNYARFIRPGFVRIGATVAPASGVTLSAFYGARSSRIVVVAINTNTSASSQTFTLSGMTPVRVVPWVTDAGNDLKAQSAIGVSGNTFSYSLPARSVTTLVIDGNGSGVITAFSCDRNTSGADLFGETNRCVLRSPQTATIDFLTLSGRILKSHHFQGGNTIVSITIPSSSGNFIVTRVRQGKETTVFPVVKTR